MADLVFSSYTIFDQSEGDVYSRTTLKSADLNTQDIAFAHSTGRELKVIGSQLTEQTSMSIGITGRMYAASRATMQSKITAIENLRLSSTTIIGTLTMTDGSFTNMRMTSFATGPILALAEGNVCTEASMTFSEYA